MKSLFLSKKGFELSINFIVQLIMAIVIFGFGIAFATRMFGGGNEISEMAYEDFNNKVQALSCSGYDQVCLAQKSVTIPKGDLKIVPFTVKNELGEDANFRVIVRNTAYIGKDNERVDAENFASSGIKPLSLFDLSDEGRVEKIANRDSFTYGIGILAPKDAVPGKYTLTFWVDYDASGSGFSDAATPSSDYTQGKTIKLFVEVQ